MEYIYIYIYLQGLGPPKPLRGFAPAGGKQFLGISPSMTIMDEIATKCAGLRLSEKEESEVDLTPPVTETGHVLVGQFCTKCQVSLESVAQGLKAVWRTAKNFEVCDMGENKVLFQFEDENDLDRVLLLSPCAFDNYLVILHNLGAGEAVNKV